jgi:hypothetical protein
VRRLGYAPVARWFHSFLAVTGAVLCASGLWLGLRDHRGGEPLVVAAPVPSAAASAPAVHEPVDAAPDPHLDFEAPHPDTASGPELARYEESVAFSEAVRAFFDGYRELGEAERDARAAEIRAQLDERERDGRVLPPEALLLRLGILRATVDDPAVLESESRRLIEEHRIAAEQTAANRVPDPRDQDYQARQAEIAREVMALAEIPGGVSREEYLRERLRELRIEMYTGGQRASQ